MLSKKAIKVFLVGILHVSYTLSISHVMQQEQWLFDICPACSKIAHMWSFIKELDRGWLIYILDRLLLLIPIDFKDETSSNLYAANSPLAWVLCTSPNSSLSMKCMRRCRNVYVCSFSPNLSKAIRDKIYLVVYIMLENNPHVIPYQKIRERLTNILDMLLLIPIGFSMKPHRVCVQSNLLLCTSPDQQIIYFDYTICSN